MPLAASDFQPPARSYRSDRALSVLVTGASGLLGHALMRALAGGGHQAIGLGRTATHHSDGCWVTMALEDFPGVAAAIAELRPDWILHAAALTDLDVCERDPLTAKAINVEASETLARAARAHGSRLLYVSTDAVYDGDLTTPHVEDETPRPVNCYAASKLAGERVCVAELPDSVIARVNFVGLHPSRSQGLAAWLIKQLRAGQRVGGFTDVVFNPLLSEDLAGLLVGALERDIPGGCYNFGASDSCSKFEFARRAAVRVGADPALVRPITLSEASLATPRPRYTVMATDRLRAALGERLPSIDECLNGLIPS